MVAVLASRLAYEEKGILGAMERRGLPARHLDTRQLRQAIGGPPSEDRLVMNREISYFKGVAAARLLEARSATVVNAAASAETCGDKLRSSLALDDAGVPTPRTVVACSTSAALEALDELGYPAVIKSVIGSWGRLTALVADPGQARTLLEHREALSSPWHRVAYLQEYLGDGARETRVVVVGGAALAAARRHGEDWRANWHRGGRVIPCALDDRHASVATQATAAVGASVGAVDMIESPDGRLAVLEVNHNVGFQGLEEAHGGVPLVADAIADHMTKLAETC